MVEDSQDSIKIYLLPGGRMPERKTEGAVGYDVFLRAIVSSSEMDPTNKVFRKTLFDFKSVPKDNPDIDRRIVVSPSDSGNELVYRMEPKESVLVGIGFATEITEVSSYTELDETKRGVGGFGSTGVR